jgi:phage gp29-like protein
VPPRSRVYTELPAVSWSDWDNLGNVKKALRDLEAGDFSKAALLVDAMGRDDRIEGVFATRLDALHSLELDFSPPDGAEEDERAEKIAAECLRGWTRWFPESALRELRHWGLWLNAGIAQVVWKKGARLEPTLQVWHPRHLRWDDSRGVYVVHTRERPVDVERGTGQWVLYQPFGERRGWMRGLVRSLAVPWLVRQWGIRDWAGHSEAHGSPAKKAKLPPGSKNSEDAKRFVREVASLAKRSAIAVEQGRKSPTGETPGYDVELLEATADGHKVFAELLAYCDTSIAVRVKGSNLTTEVKGGSFAAAQTHREVDNDKLRFDAETTSTCLHDDVLEPWAEWNHGDRALAPWASWDTEPPEDLKAYAESLDKLGDGLKKLGDAAVPVDGAALAERFDIPLREVTAEEQELLGAPQIQDFHIAAGIPSENEVRQRLRLPPRKDGDKPAGEAKRAAEVAAKAQRAQKAQKALAASAFARAALPTGAVEGQIYADDVIVAGAAEGTRRLKPDLDALLKIVREGESFEGIRAKLLLHYKGMDSSGLAEMMRRCLVLAELDGELSAREDAGLA